MESYQTTMSLAMEAKKMIFQKATLLPAFLISPHQATDHAVQPTLAQPTLAQRPWSAHQTKEVGLVHPQRPTDHNNRHLRFLTIQVTIVTSPLLLEPLALQLPPHTQAALALLVHQPQPARSFPHKMARAWGQPYPKRHPKLYPQSYPKAYPKAYLKAYPKAYLKAYPKAYPKAFQRIPPPA